MFMNRDIFHCKPGKAKDVVARFRSLSDAFVRQGYPAPRIYTDISGERYWTVVIEQDVESLDNMAEMARSVSNDPKVKEVMKDYHDLVLSGRRELYKVE